jgi:phage tail sheath protein FI
MPVTPTYPGIYIEELPSTSHTIAAAPTSVTVFVGYTHPWKTTPANFGKAVQIFSYAEYERNFGGLLLSNTLDVNMPYAVQQFFMNGGSEAYIVALQAKNYMNAANASAGAIAAATVNNAAGKVHFTAMEAADVKPISVQITDRDSVGHLTGDVEITYGDRPPEKYRGVSLTGTPQTNANHLVNRLASSAYVSVTTDAGALFANETLQLTTTIPAGGVSTFELTHFTAVFQADTELDKVPIFNLLVLPGITNPTVLSEALAFAEKKQAFVIMDPAADLNPVGGTGDANSIAWYMNNAPKSTNGALYFPYLKTTNLLTGGDISLPPSGYVAGIYARTDTNRGVWKAPAGLETTVLNTTGVVTSGRMNDMRQGVLNNQGINALRTFPGIGTVVYGARTLVAANVAFQQWKYVPVRRMALFIEQTLLRNLGWAIFEPNDVPLWTALRISIENFMESLHARGAFQGTKPSEAFFVQCDASTTTQTDINLGVVNIIVAFAPLKPAEFVIVKIAQLAGQAHS